MKLSFQARLTIFALALSLLIGLIGWAAYTSWGGTKHLRQRFTQVQLQSFRIADRVQASALELDDSYLRYLLSNQPQDLKIFRQQGTELGQWVAGRKVELSTPRERDVLAEVEQSLQKYLAAADQPMTDASGQSESPLARFARVEMVSQELLAKGDDLAEAHRAALEEFLDDTQHSLGKLQAAIVFALATLTGLGIWGGVIVYRDMIAPMRMQLVENRVLLERQEKLASLGVLAAGVAHEIRNPLTAVKARLYTQKKGLVPDSRELRDAEFIGKEIDRLERIVRDFLLFARPSEPAFVEVRPRELLQEVCDLLGAQLAQENVQLKLGEIAQLFFLADASQIKQVLINLVQNAAESMTKGGLVVLSTHADRIPLAGKSTDVVVIEVQDDGSGIPPEVQRRLFDPFFSTKQTGTGLGLAISARIVEKHGGALRFQSRVNHGTTFGIVLPVIP
ncbi:MAG: ATP-binding protein [Chthoniobacteraceae bacterium]